MADNLPITPSTDPGARTIATDQIGGVDYQRVKVTWGADGTANDVQTSQPFPVSVLGTATVSVSGSVAVTGSFFPSTQPISAASLPLPSGAATEATLSSHGTKLDLLHTDIGTASGSALPAGQNMIGHVGGVKWKTVAASSTITMTGTGAGALGDYLSGVLVIPGTAGCGTVSIQDGSSTAIVVFQGGGTTALPSLIPFFIAFPGKSSNGAWKVITGANVTAVGFGDFT